MFGFERKTFVINGFSGLNNIVRALEQNNILKIDLSTELNLPNKNLIENLTKINYKYCFIKTTNIIFIINEYSLCLVGIFNKVKQLKIIIKWKSKSLFPFKNIQNYFIFKYKLQIENYDIFENFNKILNIVIKQDNPSFIVQIKKTEFISIISNTVTLNSSYPLLKKTEKSIKIKENNNFLVRFPPKNYEFEQNKLFKKMILFCNLNKISILLENDCFFVNCFLRILSFFKNYTNLKTKEINFNIRFNKFNTNRNLSIISNIKHYSFIQFNINSYGNVYLFEFEQYHILWSLIYYRHNSNTKFNSTSNNNQVALYGNQADLVIWPYGLRSSV